MVHGWSLVGSRLARGRFPAGSHHFRGCEAGVTRLVLDCYAKASLTAVEALARGGFSDGSGGWFRAGSRLVQGWLPVGYRLVRGWLPVAFLLRHSNFACFCCDCVSADSALLCVGCKGGRVLVRNCFESGSGRVQRRAGSRLLRDWFPVGFLLLSGCPCWLTPTSLALCERFRRRFFVASPWLHGRSGAVFVTGSKVTRDWLRLVRGRYEIGFLLLPVGFRLVLGRFVVCPWLTHVNFRRRLANALLLDLCWLAMD